MALKLDMSKLRPTIETSMSYDVRTLYPQYVGQYICAVCIMSSFHQPAVFVLEKSAAQGLREVYSRFSELVRPKVVIGVLKELGGVKAGSVTVLEANGFIVPV